MFGLHHRSDGFCVSDLVKERQSRCFHFIMMMQCASQGEGTSVCVFSPPCIVSMIMKVGGAVCKSCHSCRTPGMEGRSSFIMDEAAAALVSASLTYIHESTHTSAVTSLPPTDPSRDPPQRSVS